MNGWKRFSFHIKGISMCDEYWAIITQKKVTADISVSNVRIVVVERANKILNGNRE